MTMYHYIYNMHLNPKRDVSCSPGLEMESTVRTSPFTLGGTASFVLSGMHQTGECGCPNSSICIRRQRQAQLWDDSSCRGQGAGSVLPNGPCLHVCISVLVETCWPLVHVKSLQTCKGGHGRVHCLVQSEEIVCVLYRVCNGISQEATSLTQCKCLQNEQAVEGCVGLLHIVHIRGTTLPLQPCIAGVVHTQPCASRVYFMYTWLPRTIVLRCSLGQCAVRSATWACGVEE